MATINRENIGVLNDRITVTVKEEDYNPGFQKALKEYSKNANIPGFRKGKVPAGLIKKMYGASLFPQEVLKSVEDGLNDYLKKEELNLFGQPVLQENENMPKVDMNKPEDYVFDFEIGLKPTLELGTIEEKLDFTRYKIKPEDSEIDKEIERLQNHAATYEDIDQAEKAEDIINVTFQLADKDGKVLSEEENKHEDKYRLDYFSSKLQKELKDKKKGDTLVCQLKDAFDEKELDWVIKDWKADKNTAPEEYYLLTITQIEKSVPHELNEDFFEKVYPAADIKTEEDFRKKITEDYLAQWDHQSKHLLEHEIFDKLVNETPVELPVDFLKKQLKRENGKLKTDEEVEKEYPEFEKQTKWGVITSQIIEEGKLEASPEDIKDFFRKQILGYFQMPAVTEENEKMVDELAGRLMQEENRIDEAYRTIITDKLFDWIIEKSKINDKEINSEEFIKLQQEHHKHHHEH